MKAHMSHGTEPDLEEEDGPHRMEDAVNQIRMQRQRQREQKVEQEKMEEIECDQFLGDHGIDFADLSVQEKRDIRRALQISTQDMPGTSHSFTRTPSPQPSTSGFSRHTYRRNASPIRASWNDSDDDFSENRSENRTPQSRVVRPVPQRKRPSPEGEEGTGAKAVRLKGNFYGSSSQTSVLPQRSRRNLQETPPLKPLLQQKPRHRLLDPDRPVHREEAATKSSSSAYDATVIEDDVSDDVSILGDNRGPRQMRRKLALPDGAVKQETVTSGSAQDHQSAKKAPRMFTPEELNVVEQFMKELSWKPDCQKLNRKYRTSRQNAGSDEYQSLLKSSVLTKLVIDYWDSYFCKLRQEQSRACRQLPWGPPILPGRHHSRTLDRKLRGEESFTWIDPEEEAPMDAMDMESHVPEADVWKPAKVRLTRSGKGGGGVKVRSMVEENEETDDMIMEARRDPIPLPAPSRLLVPGQGLGVEGRKGGVTMDYSDFLSECDARASPHRTGGVGGNDAIQPSQSSTSDSILNSQGDIYSTQFPRRRSRTLHASDDSNDSENLLPRLSKRNRVESQQRTATATMSSSDSVLPSRKRSRTQEIPSSGSQKVPSTVDLDMDCIAVETDARAEPDVFDLDDNEDAEKQDFLDYQTKLKEVRTYSRRRPVATVSFAKMVDEEANDDQKNLFTASSGSFSSQPSRTQAQQEDSEEEVQLLSCPSDEQQEEMATVNKPKGRIPRRRILQPLMEEAVDARDMHGQDQGMDEQEEENCQGCMLIACPMCEREFPDTEIEVHAAYCNGPEPEPERIVTRRVRESRVTTSHTQYPETDQDYAHSRESWLDKEPMTCLICDRQFPDNGPAFKKHLSQCEARATARARQLEGMEAMVVDDGTNSNPPSTRSRAGAACQ